MSLTAKRHMLFSSLSKIQNNGVGVGVEDVVWNDMGDSVGTWTGHGAEDGTPSGSTWRELLIFN